MILDMFRNPLILSTSLATAWVMGVQGVYIPPRDGTGDQPQNADGKMSPSHVLGRGIFQDANNTSVQLEGRFPISEDGRCGVNFGTSCPDDECCSSEGYVIFSNTTWYIKMLTV